MPSFQILLSLCFVINFQLRRDRDAHIYNCCFLCSLLIFIYMFVTGSIEANLLSTIVTLAIYFCLADCVIISQTMYYMYIYVDERKSSAARRQSRPENNPTQPLLSRRRSSANYKPYSSTHDDVSRPPAVADGQINAVANYIFLLLGAVLVGCLSWFLAWKSGLWSGTVDDGKKQEISWIGACLGYTSAVLYLGARLPQILKNYNKKSCDGLSILFFLLSLMGNITYGAGVSVLHLLLDFLAYRSIDSLPFHRKNLCSCKSPLVDRKPGDNGTGFYCKPL